MGSAAWPVRKKLKKTSRIFITAVASKNNQTNHTSTTGSKKKRRAIERGDEKRAAEPSNTRKGRTLGRAVPISPLIRFQPEMTSAPAKCGGVRDCPRLNAISLRPSAVPIFSVCFVLPCCQPRCQLCFLFETGLVLMQRAHAFTAASLASRGCLVFQSPLASRPSVIPLMSSPHNQKISWKKNVTARGWFHHTCLLTAAKQRPQG